MADVISVPEMTAGEDTAAAVTVETPVITDGLESAPDNTTGKVTVPEMTAGEDTSANVPDNITDSLPENEATVEGGLESAPDNTVNTAGEVTVPEKTVATPTSTVSIFLSVFTREKWREEWTYSFPVVIIETMWNIAFVALSFSALFWYTREDTTNWRLRVWIFTSSIHCLVHLAVLLVEYKRRISLMLSSVSCCSASRKARVTPIRTLMLVRVLLALFTRRCGASIVVRQNVAAQLKSWQDDWSYKLPFVVVVVLWSLTCAVLSFAALFWFEWKDANWRLRLYIFGYSLQHVLHVVLLLLKYKQGNRRVSSMMSLINSCSSSESDEDHVPTIRCQMATKVFSYLWWLFGVFCLMSSYTTPGNATFLLWLTVGFLAMDVFFAVIRLLFVSLVGVACCLCLSCVIAFLYYVSSQGSTSEAEINNLIEHKFEVSNADVEQPDARTCRIIPMRTDGSDFSTEHDLQTEDAECCICLCDFEDGGQLLLLPCNHPFHSACIVKWLRLKASCPVCKSLVTPVEQV